MYNHLILFMFLDTYKQNYSNLFVHFWHFIFSKRADQTESDESYSTFYAKQREKIE